jgi:hypothetical protein
MKRRLVAASVLVGLFAAAAGAVLDGITLKRSGPVGQKIEYKLEAHLSFAGQDADITANGVDTLTALKPDGTSTIDVVQSDLTVNGQPYSVASQATTIVQNADGSVVSFSGVSDTSGGTRRQAMLVFYYPKNPVKIGDSWSYDFTPDSKIGPAYRVQLKYTADETIGKHDAAKIEGTIAETGGTDAASAKTTYWIDKTDGSLVKEIAEVKNIPFGPPGDADGKLTYTRTN